MLTLLLASAYPTCHLRASYSVFSKIISKYNFIFQKKNFTKKVHIYNPGRRRGIVSKVIDFVFPTTLLVSPLNAEPF